MNPPSRNLLHGKEIEQWFKKFTHREGVHLSEALNLEKVIQLLDAELPKRFENGLRNLDADYPEGDRWIRQVLLAKESLSLSNQIKQEFAEYLLDQVVSTDVIIELPGKDGDIKRIAIDVTANARKSSSKLEKIEGLPDKNDKHGENRNRNIEKVRRELGITKHLLLILNSERSLLPSYDTLLTTLNDFARSETSIGSISLRDLPSEQTIAGEYRRLAIPHAGKQAQDRIRAIAEDSLLQRHHWHYTIQVIFNDPTFQRIDDVEKAKALALQQTFQQWQRTSTFRICTVIDHLLQEQGKSVGSGLEFETPKLIFRKDNTVYSLHSTDARGLLFQGDGKRYQAHKLTQEELKSINKLFLITQQQSQTQHHSKGISR